MGLTNDERQSIVNYRIEKAQSTHCIDRLMPNR